MNSHPKFIIYYTPDKEDMPDIVSITLAFSRINEEYNVYKKKLIVEKIDENGNVKKHTMTEMHTGVSELLQKIESVDFDKPYDKITDADEERIFIQYGDKKIYTPNIDQLFETLSLFDFWLLVEIPCEHFDIIKDMSEYAELLVSSGLAYAELNEKQKKMYYNILMKSPYDIFEHLGYLGEYLNRFIKT